jgi:hypothetical protein
LNPLAYDVLTPCEVISKTYRLAIDAITKCLWHFAKDQQYLHSSDPLVHR